MEREIRHAAKDLAMRRLEVERLQDKLNQKLSDYNDVLNIEKNINTVATFQRIFDLEGEYLKELREQKAS